MLRILSWNIDARGRKRVEQIAAAIQSHHPDVVLLSEFRICTTKRLDHLLAKQCLKCYGTSRLSNSTGIAVYSLFPVAVARQERFAARWVNVSVTDHDVEIAALHIPCGNDKNTPKAAMWDEVLEFAEKRRKGRVALIGDLNTGLRIDEQVHKCASRSPRRRQQFLPEFEDRKPDEFDCWEQFLRLSEIYVDAWRQQNGTEALDFSYYSDQGNGFRIDHAFVSAALAEALVGCAYSHDERDPKEISDHSSLILHLAV